MQTPRIVPWANKKEFLEIGELLYAPENEVHKRIEGVERVKIWRSRGKIPVSIDITADLVEVWIRDNHSNKQSVNQGSLLSDTELRMMYGMAIVRFVNLLIDQEQKGVYAMSLWRLAERLGLPSWLVELRHSATHEALPSLNLLRMGCLVCLEYINREYFSLSTGKINELKNQTIREIYNLLVKYKKGKLRYNQVEDAIGLSANNGNNNLNTKDVIEMIVVPLLLDPNLDLIVPLDSKKRPSFGAGSKMKIDAHTLELYKPFLTGTQRTQQTQQSRQKKRLRGFDTASETKQSSEGTFFTNTFISSLIERIVSMDNMGNSPLNKNTDFEFLYPASQKRDKGNNNSTVGCVYTCWLKYFLECNLSSLGSTQSQNISFDLDSEYLLEICLRKPNVFTRFILKTFCKFDPSLKEAISPFLHYQRKMFLDSLLSSRPNTSNQQMVDLPSLFSELEEYQSQLTTRIDSFNSISKYGSMSTHPLGILPNGQLSVLELPSSINLDESSSDSDN